MPKLTTNKTMSIRSKESEKQASGAGSEQETSTAGTPAGTSRSLRQRTGINYNVKEAFKKGGKFVEGDDSEPEPEGKVENPKKERRKKAAKVEEPSPPKKLCAPSWVLKHRVGPEPGAITKSPFVQDPAEIEEAINESNALRRAFRKKKAMKGMDSMELDNADAEADTLGKKEDKDIEMALFEESG